MKFLIDNKVKNKFLREFDATRNLIKFKDSLERLTTLHLDDDQVRMPDLVDSEVEFLFQLDKIYFYIRNRDELPPSGPFEIYILDINDDVVGFIRGTKGGGDVISFNLIFISEEERGYGLGYSIYEYFLNKGFSMKSDTEISEGTSAIYNKLISNNYQPIVFEDGRVGVKK